MSAKSRKLRFYRKKKSTQDQSEELPENMANAERTETSFSICEKEYLTNKNLSIMTDTQLDPDLDVVDNVCLRQKKPDTIKTSNSSDSACSQDSYILISTEELAEEMSVKSKDWEYVEYSDIAEHIKNGLRLKKYCSPRCSAAWLLKIRRGILKNRCSKIYPAVIDG